MNQQQDPTEALQEYLEQCDETQSPITSDHIDEMYDFFLDAQTRNNQTPGDKECEEA